MVVNFISEGTFVDHLHWFMYLRRESRVNAINLSILKTGKAKAIRFSTLQAICEVLDCQPGEILEYVNEKEG